MRHISSGGREFANARLVAACVGVAAVAAAAPSRAAALAPPATACPGAYAPVLGLTPAQAEHATRCLINHIRAARGLRRLRSSPALGTMAGGFAQDMVTAHFFSHAGPDGTDLVSRVAAAGLKDDPSTCWSVGEDLAWGLGADAQPSQIVAEWMLSAPHRRNLLGRKFRWVGVGVDLGVPPAGAAAAASAQGGGTYVVDVGYSTPLK